MVVDVPNAVIRLEKYVASDALDKAKSSKLSNSGMSNFFVI